MKTVMKTIAAAAFGILLLSSSVIADPIIEAKAECKNNTCENFRVGMYRVRNTVSMNVLMEKQKGQRVSIKLLDVKGKVMHEEVVPKYLTKFGRRLNFEEIKDGDYTLEISDDSEKIVKNIHLETNDVRETTRTLVGMN